MTATAPLVCIAATTSALPSARRTARPRMTAQLAVLVVGTGASAVRPALLMMIVALLIRCARRSREATRSATRTTLMSPPPHGIFIKTVSLAVAMTKDIPPPSIAMTKPRLWFLFHVCGFPKSAIVRLTGWRKSQIDAGLDRWDMRMFGSETYWTTSGFVETQVASQLGFLFPELNVLGTRFSFQVEIQRVLMRDGIHWDRLDDVASQLLVEMTAF